MHAIKRPAIIVYSYCRSSQSLKTEHKLKICPNQLIVFSNTGQRQTYFPVLYRLFVYNYFNDFIDIFFI